MNADELRILLIETYASTIVTLWGFYFTVVVGTVTLMASLLGETKKINIASAAFLGILLLFFGVSNWLSVYELSNLMQSNVSEVTDNELRGVLEGQGYNPWSNYLHPIGILLALFFVLSKTNLSFRNEGNAK